MLKCSWTTSESHKPALTLFPLAARYIKYYFEVFHGNKGSYPEPFSTLSIASLSGTLYPYFKCTDAFFSGKFCRKIRVCTFETGVRGRQTGHVQ